MTDEPTAPFPAPPGKPPEANKPVSSSPNAPLADATTEGTASIHAAPPAPQTNAKSPGRGLAALGGGVVGFLLGLGVAWSLRPASAPSAAPSATTSEKPNASARRKSVAAGPREVVLDFGSEDADRALRGPWTKVQLAQHSAAQTPGPKSTIELQVSPDSSRYALAVLAQAPGTAAEEAVEVGVQVNQRKVGRWRIGPDWDMQAVVLPSGSLAAGLNVVEFVLPPADAEHRSLLAVATLHLGPLRAHAEVGLAGAEVRGSFIRGYYGREGEGADAATWSSGLRTRAGLLLAPENSQYELEVRGHAFEPLQPLAVEAVVNSRSIGTVQMDKGPTYVFRAPPGVFTSGLNIVELVYPKAVRPSEVLKGSEDNREIAIRIAGISAAPAAAAE
jgi:hypothetical protein